MSNQINRHGTLLGAIPYNEGLFAFGDSRLTIFDGVDKLKHTIRDETTSKFYMVTRSIYALTAGYVHYSKLVVREVREVLKGKDVSLLDLEKILVQGASAGVKNEVAKLGLEYKENDFIEVLFVGGRQEKLAFKIRISLFNFTYEIKWMKSKAERRNIKEQIHDKHDYLLAGSGIDVAESFVDQLSGRNFFCDLEEIKQFFFIASNRTCLVENKVGGVMWTLTMEDNNSNSICDYHSPFEVQLKDKGFIKRVILLRQRVTEIEPTENIVENLKRREGVYAVTQLFCEGDIVYFRIFTEEAEEEYNEILRDFGRKDEDGIFVVIGQLPEFSDSAITHCTEEFLENMEKEFLKTKDKGKMVADILNKEIQLWRLE